MTSPLPSVDQLVSSITASEDDDLGRVQMAVVMADELGTMGDQVVTHFVGAARQKGCSWSQIGAQLGVSKQAAQQAFVAPTRRRGRFGPHRRYGAGFRAVMVAMQAESASFGHKHIGTEHLLLALGAEPGLAAAALRQLGVEQDAIRAHVVEILGRGTAGPSAHRPVTPRTKKVLELALREAVRLKSEQVETEHLLLALMREGQGVAAQILVQNLGIDLVQVSQAVHDVIRNGGPRTPGEPPTG